MSKPKTRDEAYLRKKFKHEEEIPYAIERDVRVNKRIWKRKTSKLHRKHDKQEIKKVLKDDE